MWSSKKTDAYNEIDYTFRNLLKDEIVSLSHLTSAAAPQAVNHGVDCGCVCPLCFGTFESIPCDAISLFFFPLRLSVCLASPLMFFHSLAKTLHLAFSNIYRSVPRSVGWSVCHILLSSCSSSILLLLFLILPCLPIPRPFQRPPRPSE